MSAISLCKYTKIKQNKKEVVLATSFYRLFVLFLICITRAYFSLTNQTPS